MDVRCEFFPATPVGQVATSLAGQVDLAAKALVLVEQDHATPVAEHFGGPDGRHHAGGTAAHNGQAVTHHSWKNFKKRSSRMYMLSSMSPEELLL